MFNEWSYLNSVQFPETAIWFKRIDPKNVEDDVTYKGATPFRFRIVANEDGTYQPIKGLKTQDKSRTFQIESADDRDFTSGDIIEFAPEVRYTIESVSLKMDDRNTNEYLDRARDWPGLMESVKIKIISLV